jgi:hypothetical protein
MLGSEIILASSPKGVFQEGIAQGTWYPGTMITQVPGIASIVGQGRLTWQAGWSQAGAADGDPRLVTIATPDVLQGQIWSTQQLTGVRCFGYTPYPGEEMNILLEGEQGTGSANAFTAGERLISRHATGLWVLESTSSFNAPFMSQEHLDEAPDITALLWTMRQ